MYEEPNPKPIPQTPTHCRGCDSVLEPLRRWGGMCRQCVRDWQGTHKRLDAQQAAEPVFRWRVIKQITRLRPDGRHEKYVQCACVCGTKRTMTLSSFEQRRSYACRGCHMREVRVRGVESDYAK